ncbi:GntR family transcriptional regulator [Salinicoccus roseus]|uniref:GntR family transcriptional regulator n=1 Tax=Salinicoccus roseus TaxID=45670 RepID=UPI001EF5F769|nr:GntR family transcriptional regulator [Salinicoccus roseus]MCG7332463.1 GntR family transcriptional regulator [Salinicoccus roseus]
MKESNFNISNESIIRNAIQEQIMNNELKPGDTLPSENVLTDEFGMKRIVVRNALMQLEKMGLLDSRQGVDYESKVIFAGYATEQLASMFNYYGKHGYTNLKSMDTHIHTAFPTLEEQRHLECEELVPLIVYESQTMDLDKNRILEQTRILYRSDLFKHVLGSVN